MIPQALKSLFSYLGKQGLLPNAQHLIDWVNINARGLQDLSNPQLDQFYRDLVAAMRREGVVFFLTEQQYRALRSNIWNNTRKRELNWTRND